MQARWGTCPGFVPNVGNREAAAADDRFDSGGAFLALSRVAAGISSPGAQSIHHPGGICPIAARLCRGARHIAGFDDAGPTTILPAATAAHGTPGMVSSRRHEYCPNGWPCGFVLNFRDDATTSHVRGNRDGLACAILPWPFRPALERDRLPCVAGAGAVAGWHWCCRGRPPGPLSPSSHRGGWAGGRC